MFRAWGVFCVARLRRARVTTTCDKNAHRCMRTAVRKTLSAQFVGSNMITAFLRLWLLNVRSLSKRRPL